MIGCNSTAELNTRAQSTELWDQDHFLAEAEGPPKIFPSFQPRGAHCTFHFHLTSIRS
jgi:hypothetical protein